MPIRKALQEVFWRPPKKVIRIIEKKKMSYNLISAERKTGSI